MAHCRKHVWKPECPKNEAYRVSFNAIEVSYIQLWEAFFLMLRVRTLDDEGNTEQQLINACNKMARTYSVFKLKQLLK